MKNGIVHPIMYLGLLWAIVPMNAFADDRSEADRWDKLISRHISRHWDVSLSSFKWKSVGQAEMPASAPETLQTTSGHGIMFIAGATKSKDVNILSKQEFGDIELHVEFLIPKNSNSGLYLMGRYEVQILDSHGKANPNEHDCGAIYERWDAQRGKGREGFEGHAPRVNAARPAGQWQSFDIIFRAPRFGSDGKKTSNARFEKALLNGVIIHEDVEVTGPTRGAAFTDEQATGPLWLQGNHGPVAFRDIRVRRLRSELPLANRATAVEGEQPIVPASGPVDLLTDDLKQLYSWLEDTKYEDPNCVFTIQDGVLRISGQSWGGLITKQRYANYHLVCEFKWGQRLWGKRKGLTRDSGLLIHCLGPDGAYNNRWMVSIEANIIEGGMGDFLALSTRDSRTGQLLSVAITAETMRDRDGEYVWSEGGQPVTFRRGRINWRNRDPDWKNITGFRGKNDVERPFGQWNRFDVICKGNEITVVVNGVVVNHCYNVRPSAGKVLLQSEGTELFVRRWELWPLDKAPKYEAE